MASFLSSALTSVALFLALTSSLVAADFDVYYYGVMWPGAYCTQMKPGRCCMPSTGAPAEDFYVSTMATYTNDGKEVKKCSSSNFYINELLDLSESLQLYWPSIKCPQNDGKSSWRSIWKTFGVCTNLSEHDYFEKALQIRTDVNVLRILEDNGIVPDGSNYSLASIQQALDNGIGQKVAIQCSKIYNTSLYQLFRIFFCVDQSDASTIVSCPFVSKYKCPDEVVFSHFDVGMLKGFTALPELNPIKLYPENE
ncbi:extracellular ribonuclease LE-like [Nymphaea colorata]|nr:extracellular ribonuclease LE-like [Nymphaea colorata]